MNDEDNWDNWVSPPPKATIEGVWLPVGHYDNLKAHIDVLESKVKAQAELLELARPIVLKAQVYSRTYGGNPPTVIEEWLSDLEKLQSEEAGENE